MKTIKYVYPILIVCVSALILMQSVLAATGPPYVWAAQATLSTVDVNPSQDPENSGYGTLQVTVWEEWNPITLDWDIYMKYSLADGAPGSWVFPLLHPATLPLVNEINPAVSVSRNHAVLGQEIHVVYQRWNGVNWEICHTYTNNLGAVWSFPVVISTAGVTATNPACVYTEDQSNPGGVIGTLFQVVWEELFAPGRYQIMYRAFAYDPTWVPVRGYVPAIGAPPFIIRTPVVPGTSSELPEIASVDERVSAGSYDYYFSIVWQETDGLGNWNVWYVDGTTTTSTVPPPPPPATIVISVATRLNVPAPATQHTDPDIAASQTYQPIGGGVAETYFFCITYVRQTPVAGPPAGFNFDIDYCLYYGMAATPGALAFTAPASAYTAFTGAIPPVLFDNPTIATKLTSPAGAVPITFEAWFAWEDNFAAALTDIWYTVGTYTSGAVTPFVLALGLPARVPYLPNPGGTIEQNPELWNREDALRLNPPVTHLVFDVTAGALTEVEYIDP